MWMPRNARVATSRWRVLSKGSASALHGFSDKRRRRVKADRSDPYLAAAPSAEVDDEQANEVFQHVARAEHLAADAADQLAVGEGHAGDMAHFEVHQEWLGLGMPDARVIQPRARAQRDG